jgi:hypothetical protein
MGLLRFIDAGCLTIMLRTVKLERERSGDPT